MNKTLLLITFTTLFASVYASPFTDGFIMGVIMNSIDSDDTPSPPKKSIDNSRYIHQIIDTELIPFTPKYHYKCYEIKKFIPLTTYERFTTSILMAMCCLAVTGMLCNMDDDGRDFMIGYMVARSTRRRRRW
tara:strand:+ start:2520 stop:2915 length:396 start_codon:yes stop_codon:yes gene_type:complete